MPSDDAARVEFERPVNQRNRQIEVLAKTREHAGRVGKHRWIVIGDLEGPASQLDRLVMVHRLIIGPTIDGGLQMPPGRQGERRAVSRIVLDRLFEQAERPYRSSLIEG